jgi:hypothetical protein
MLPRGTLLPTQQRTQQRRAMARQHLAPQTKHPLVTIRRIVNSSYNLFWVAFIVIMILLQFYLLLLIIFIVFNIILVINIIVIYESCYVYWFIWNHCFI